MAARKKKTTKEEREACKMVTPIFRGSYVTLVKPRAIGDGDPKYSLAIVLPKDHDFWTRFEEAQTEVIRQKFGDDAPDLDDMKLPRKDGDAKKSPDEWAGCYSIRASNKDKPGCVKRDEDGELEPIEDRAELYSGAWYRASIRVFGWSHPTGGDGVSVQLDNVMEIRDDEPFSGRKSAEDDFAGVMDDEDEGEDNFPARGNGTTRPRKNNPLA